MHPCQALPAHIVSAPLSCQSAAEMFEVLGQLACARGMALRAPPPEPTTCCGRGCNGCVWEGFLDAATFWREDALRALQPDANASAQPSCQIATF